MRIFILSTFIFALQSTVFGLCESYYYPENKIVKNSPIYELLISSKEYLGIIKKREDSKIVIDGIETLFQMLNKNPTLFPNFKKNIGTKNKLAQLFIDADNTEYFCENKTNIGELLDLLEKGDLKDTIKNHKLKTWNKFGLKNLEEKTLNTDHLYPNNKCSTFFEKTKSKAVECTHQISPVIITFRNTDWKIQKVTDYLENAAKIYSQCGIKFKNTKLIVADSPKNEMKIGTNIHPDLNYGDEKFQLENQALENNFSSGNLAFATPIFDQAIIYLIQGYISNESICDGGNLAPAYALTPYKLEYPHNYDKIWMASVNMCSKNSQDFYKKQSLAHELAHVLLTTGHHPETGLLSVKLKGVSTKLTDEECSQIRNHRFVVEGI